MWGNMSSLLVSRYTTIDWLQKHCYSIYNRNLEPFCCDRRNYDAIWTSKVSNIFLRVSIGARKYINDDDDEQRDQMLE